MPIARRRPSAAVARFFLTAGLLTAGGALFPMTGEALAQTGAAVSDDHRPLDIVPPLGAPAVAATSGPKARQTIVGAVPGGGQVMALDFAAAETGAAGTAAGTATDTGFGMIGRWADAVGYWLGYAYTGITDGLTPPSPETFAKSFRKSKNPDDFWQLVSDAGYKLKEISTDVGVVPDVSFSFRYVRELSDGDINWLERKLRHHEDKHRDPLSFAQRAIIYTLLSINTSDFYYVEELKVKLLPLPTARFSLTPWDSDLSWEHDTLMRAIQGQKHARRKPAEEEPHY